jgi:hypothetical protein
MDKLETTVISVSPAGWGRKAPFENGACRYFN